MFLQDVGVSTDVAGFSVTVTVTCMSLSIVAARLRRALKVRALMTGDIATRLDAVGLLVTLIGVTLVAAASLL